MSVSFQIFFGVMMWFSSVRIGMECACCNPRCNRHIRTAASFEFEAIQHRVVRQDGAADIELGPRTVVWRFDDAHLEEMLNLIEPLVDIIKPAHNYFDDLNHPDATLMLSVDEYVSGGPFAKYPHGLPVPPSED